MRKLFNKIAVAMMVISSLLVINLASVSAQNKDQICQGLTRTGGSCQGGDTAVNNLIRAVINTFSIIVGIVAVIMIMVGGFKYITSSGDSGSIQSAKNTILYAIVGLIIVALAQAIVRFVLDRATT